VKRLITLSRIAKLKEDIFLPEKKTFEGQDVIGGVHQFNLCFVFGVINLVKTENATSSVPKKKSHWTKTLGNSETEQFDEYFLKQVLYNFLISLSGIF